VNHTYYQSSLDQMFHLQEVILDNISGCFSRQKKCDCPNKRSENRDFYFFLYYYLVNVERICFQWASIL